MKILKERQSIIKHAEADKLLFASIFKGNKLEVYSLSPSSLSSQLFDLEISSLITEYGSPMRRSIERNPNTRSVVLLLKLGHHRILLGSDLELNDNPKLGWLDIIQNSQIIKTSEKSMYFKIPHHGSRGSHCVEAWNELIKPQPISTLTPWNRNIGLPENKMLDEFSQLSKELYITSSITVSKKPKRRDAKTTKAIRQFNNSVQEIRFKQGIISTEVNFSDPDSIWTTTLTGSAEKIK